MRTILPLRLGEADFSKHPLFFLAGPVLGGGDWQHEACKKLQELLPDFYAAIPCRYDNDHPLRRFEVGSNADSFQRQLTWERYYLSRASKHGCIIFWLPCESKKFPRNDGNPYAMDTRGELGEWRAHLMHDDSVRIVIGAERDFPGLSQIERNFKEAVNKNFIIWPTLEATISAAVRRAKREKIMHQAL